MRFLHTSDWHIGLKAAHAGQAGERLRAARLETGRRIADLARTESLDFVLVAGDTFDSSNPRATEILAVAEILDGMGCPVFVIPGNHDPDVAAGGWEHGVWAQKRNVRVLRTKEPAAVEGGVIYPCPMGSRWGAGDPMAWIPVRSAGDGVRIGLAHGGMATAGVDGEIRQDAAERYGMDYVALGDWHSTSARLEGIRMAYSGSHEATAFDDRDAGNVLLVEVAAAGELPRIEKRRVGALEWLRRGKRLERAGDGAALAEEVRRLAGQQRLLEVKISGTLFDQDAAALDALEAELAGKFLHARLIREGMAAGEREVALPEGFLAEAERRLRTMAEGGDAAASQALIELARIAREAGA